MRRKTKSHNKQTTRRQTTQGIKLHVKKNSHWYDQEDLGVYSSQCIVHNV